MVSWRMWFLNYEQSFHDLTDSIYNSGRDIIQNVWQGNCDNHIGFIKYAAPENQNGIGWSSGKHRVLVKLQVAGFSALYLFQINQLGCFFWSHFNNQNCKFEYIMFPAKFPNQNSLSIVPCAV